MQTIQVSEPTSNAVSKCMKDEEMCEFKNEKELLRTRLLRYNDTVAEGSDRNNRRNTEISPKVHECSKHGMIDLSACQLNLKTTRQALKFTSFLMQFKFKLLKIEDVPAQERQKQHLKLLRTIMFYLENSDTSNLYFPVSDEKFDFLDESTL